MILSFALLRHCRLALGPFSFPALLGDPRHHRSHANPCSLGDSRGEVGEFVGLQLAVGQDRHGEIHDCVGWGLCHCGFGRPQIVAEEVESPAMGEAVDEQAAIVGLHDLGLATAVVDALHRVGQRLAEISIGVGKNLGDRH